MQIEVTVPTITCTACGATADMVAQALQLQGGGQYVVSACSNPEGWSYAVQQAEGGGQVPFTLCPDCTAPAFAPARATMAVKAAAFAAAQAELELERNAPLAEERPADPQGA